jgi:hypothetical protein
LNELELQSLHSTSSSFLLLRTAIFRFLQKYFQSKLSINQCIH